MDIFLTVGFWLLAFVYLMFIHVMVLGLASMLLLIPFNLTGLSDKTLAIVTVNMGGAIGLYGYAYNEIWQISFNEPAPILFYVLGLIASWMGSGSDTVEANLGNKLMTSGEVTGILICIVIAIVNGVSFL